MVKKLQLANLIGLFLIIIEALLIFFIIGLKGMIYSLNRGGDDWIIWILIFLGIFIIEGIYFSLTLKFYKSNKNEKKITKIALWINIITIFILIIISLIISYNLLVNPPGDPWVLLFIIMLGGIFLTPPLIISFILFLIGYKKAKSFS